MSEQGVVYRYAGGDFATTVKVGERILFFSDNQFKTKLDCYGYIKKNKSIIRPAKILTTDNNGYVGIISMIEDFDENRPPKEEVYYYSFNDKSFSPGEKRPGDWRAWTEQVLAESNSTSANVYKIKGEVVSDRLYGDNPKCVHLINVEIVACVVPRNYLPVTKPEEEKIDNSTPEALKCGHPLSDRTTLIMGSGSSTSCMARDYPTHGPATIGQQKIRNEYIWAKLAEEIEKKRRFATSVGWNPFDLDLED